MRTLDMQTHMHTPTPTSRIMHTHTLTSHTPTHTLTLHTHPHIHSHHAHATHHTRMYIITAENEAQYQQVLQYVQARQFQKVHTLLLYNVLLLCHTSSLCPFPTQHYKGSLHSPKHNMLSFNVYLKSSGMYAFIYRHQLYIIMSLCPYTNMCVPCIVVISVLYNFRFDRTVEYSLMESARIRMRTE